LQLGVSTRAVAPDGLSDDHALPDQVVDIRVSRNYGRAAFTILSWALIAGLGAASVKYGAAVYDPVVATILQAIK
jgi:hypothetical protein